MDKKEALKKVKNNGWDLYELDDKFKKDKDVVTAAGFSDLAKKTAQEAIKMLKTKEDKEKWTEELDRLLAPH